MEYSLPVITSSSPNTTSNTDKDTVSSVSDQKMSIEDPIFSLPLSSFTAELGQSVESNESFALESRRMLYTNPMDAPLYRGFGTHYAFLWVGSPPQRVSVIVDTGSHHTAFPCAGCNCGRHMNMFDPKKSSSAKVMQCLTGSKGKCVFSQSYSEGSSWKAHKIIDEVWVGGSTVNMVSEGGKLSTKFTFGCMQSETGLFRGQVVDGIMGMSAASDTLAYQLFENKVFNTRAFSMCFRVGGGVLTLGGIDERLNHSPIQYVKLLKPQGWFTVRLLEVALTRGGSSGLNGTDAATSEAPRVIVAPVGTYGKGKGCIVDSGTTDTYLPAAIAKQFNHIFKELTGKTYSNKAQTIPSEDFRKLPVFVFKLEGSDGKPVTIRMPPESYSEDLGPDKYAFRVYVNEPSGAVLGANFMNNQNILFDIDHKRIGFAYSSCEFTDVSTVDISGEMADREADILFDKSGRKKALRDAAKKNEKGKGKGKDKGEEGRKWDSSVAKSKCSDPPRPLSPCLSRCDEVGGKGAREVKGWQKWTSPCPSSSSGGTNAVATPVEKECTILCLDKMIVAGESIDCLEGPWSTCSPVCQQIREIGFGIERGSVGVSNAKCGMRTETRGCYRDKCPLRSDDISASFNFRIASVAPVVWSYRLTEELERTMNAVYRPAVNASIALEQNIGVVGNDVGVFLTMAIRVPHNGMKIVMELIGSDTFTKEVCSGLQRLDSRANWAWLSPGDISIDLSTPVHFGGSVRHSNEGWISLSPMVQVGEERTGTRSFSMLLQENSLLVGLLVFVAAITACIFRRLTKRHFKSNARSPVAQASRYRRYPQV